MLKSSNSLLTHASWSVKQTVIRLHRDVLSSNIPKLVALLGKQFLSGYEFLKPEVSELIG